MVQQAELLREGLVGLDVGVLRTTLLRMAHACHAPEPEDLTHDIIVRLLVRGALGVARPPAYWWIAAQNMAIDQARERQRFVPLDFDRAEVVEEAPPPEADVSGLNLAAEELAWLLAYYEAPWGAHKERVRDRVRACRLRKKARAA